MARQKFFDRSIAVVFDATLSDEARSKLLAATAKREFVRADAQNEAAAGRRLDHTRSVDGRVGVLEDAVKPDGAIVYEWAGAVRVDVIAFAMETVRMLAPVLRGRYRESIVLHADGVETSDYRKAAEASEIVITSTVPYARKIEGGGHRSPQSKQARDGVFRVAAEEIRARFGNVAAVKFSFVSPEGGGSMLEQWARSTSQGVPRELKGGDRSDRAVAGWKKRYEAGSAKRERSRHAWNRRQPAVQISFR